MKLKTKQKWFWTVFSLNVNEKLMKKVVKCLENRNAIKNCYKIFIKLNVNNLKHLL